MCIFRSLVAVAVLGLAGAASSSGPGNEAHLPSQAVADVLRSEAGADIAFLPAGMVKETFDASNLATLLQFPTEELAVVQLKGAQIRKALERSVALYPSPNTSFLQLSGLVVTYSKSAPPERRIQNVQVGNARLDDVRVYNVAMPGTLARGGLGYFKVWAGAPVTPKLPGKTLEMLLKGKKPTETDPRWIATP